MRINMKELCKAIDKQIGEGNKRIEFQEKIKARENEVSKELAELKKCYDKDSSIIRDKEYELLYMKTVSNFIKR